MSERFVKVWSLRRVMQRPERLTAIENAKVLEGILRDGGGREHGVMVPKLPPQPARVDDAAVVWNVSFAEIYEPKRRIERMMRLAEAKKSA